jgi:hypothetical protein
VKTKKKIAPNNQPVFVMLKTNDKYNTVWMFDTKQFKGFVSSEYNVGVVEEETYELEINAGFSLHASFATAATRQACIDDALQALGLTVNQPQGADSAV